MYSPGALVAYGLRDEELAFATDRGATAVVNVAQEDAMAATQRLCGDGLDLVVETAGAVDAVELATQLVRPGGRIVLLGIAGEGKVLELPADRIVFGDMDVIGSCSYPTASWSRMVRLLEQGVVELEPIITHRFAAAQFEDAIAVLEDRPGMVAKVLLEHVPET